MDALPDRGQLIERYASSSGRDVASISWYDVFARWKLAIVLEGSYAKFLRGQSDKPLHEFFGRQADLLLASAERHHRAREPRHEPDRRRDHASVAGAATPGSPSTCCARVEVPVPDPGPGQIRVRVSGRGDRIARRVDVPREPTR